jgi:hypothetical protein
LENIIMSKSASLSAALRLSALAVVTALAGGAAIAGPNDPDGRVPADAPAGSLANNQGALLCTAAINSDASIAGGTQYVASATSLGTGYYEVIFKGACKNITAARGWARMVQVDTLTTGSISGVSCTSADRAGNVDGVWVSCTDGAGAQVNTSFFLFVLR